MRKKGFSLIELMIVLAILSIIVVLTATNMGFMDRMLLRVELDKLHTTCMYAQKVAMVTNKKQVITFDQAQKTYTFNGRKEVLPSSINFGFKAGAKGPPSAPQNAINSAITFQQQQITFKPNGIIQPGTIYLVDNQKNTMYAISSPISQVSFLRKYRYDKEWELITK